MDYIISHGQLGKALDRPALIALLLPFLFLLFHPEHIALGNENKFKQRIFKAPVEISVGNHDLSRKNLPFCAAFLSFRLSVRTVGP